MIQVTESSHLGFLSTTIRTTHYEVSVVPGIGGRIIAFGANGVNLLYQNEALAGHRPAYEVANADEMRSLRERGQILLYGGEKTWLAPQSDWGGCPYADLDHGEYGLQISRSGETVRLILTSPVCRETQLQLSGQLHAQSTTRNWRSNKSWSTMARALSRRACGR